MNRHITFEEAYGIAWRDLCREEGQTPGLPPPSGGITFEIGMDEMRGILLSHLTTEIQPRAQLIKEIAGENKIRGNMARKTLRRMIENKEVELKQMRNPLNLKSKVDGVRLNEG